MEEAGTPREDEGKPPKKGVPPQIHKHNAQREAEGLETSAKVWELKKRGYSFRQIAAQLGMSPSGVYDAHRRVIRALKEDLAEAADDWLHLQIARLEEVAAFQFRVMKGEDVRPTNLRKRHEEAGLTEPSQQPVNSMATIEERLAAARDIVKTSESLRKMLGIDAPEKKEHTGHVMVGTLDLSELGGAELARELEALSAGLRTRSPEQVRELVETTDGKIVVDEASANGAATQAQPQEV